MLLPPTYGKTELMEVVRIDDPLRHVDSEDLAGVTVALWERDRAQQALSLIAGLPSGEQSRCFLPGWGIRAHDTTHQLFEIAFCFRCHGARAWGPDLPLARRRQSFDAESPAALELLRRFRSGPPG